MTKTETLIVDLIKTVSTLEEALSNARTEIARLDAERSRLTDAQTEIKSKLAVIEDNVKELKKLAEERERRRWTIILALVGCLLTLAANIGLTYWKLQK